MPGGVDPVLRFMVKFYMPDPSQLEEEYTRYNLIMLLMKAYLIFVIFFTQPQFEAWKFYT